MVIVRASGREASRRGKEDVRLRANTQKAKLLIAFHMYGPMISERAASLAELDCEHWAKCGEMREAGLIAWAVREDSGEQIYMTSHKGSECGVYVITAKGHEEARRLLKNIASHS